MIMALTIVAKITATDGNAAAVKTALTNLIAPTRAEAGCIQYDLHQDTTDPHVFLFFELWESRALWQDHLASDHITAHKAANGHLIAGVILNEMTHIG